MTGISTNHASVAAQLERAAAQTPGWSSLDELLALFNLAFGTADLGGDLLEVGSWCGRTATALGLAAKMTGATRLHCIDLFPRREDWRRNPDGNYHLRVSTPEGVVQAFTEHPLWQEPYERSVVPLYEKHESILEIFMETLERHALTDVVSVHHGTSAVLATRFPENFRCRLAFIDGDHGHDAVCADIRNIEPFLVAGGWFCFDDAFTCYDGVNRAIEESILANGKYDSCQQLTRKLFVARRVAEAA